MLEETFLHYALVRVFAGNLRYKRWSEGLYALTGILHGLMPPIAPELRANLTLPIRERLADQPLRNGRQPLWLEMAISQQLFVIPYPQRMQRARAA